MPTRDEVIGDKPEGGGTDQRRPDWGLLQRIALLWFACYATALLIDEDRWVLSRWGLLESLALLVIPSLLVALAAPVHAFLKALSRAQRLFVAGVVGALLLGQMTGWRPERTFPLVSWRMFATGPKLEPFNFFEFVGDTEAGQQIPLNPSRLFPSLKNFTMTVSLARLAERVTSGASAGEDKADAERRLSGLLAAIGRMHNRLSPHERIGAVAVIRCRLDPRAAAAERVGRVRVWTVPLEATRR